MTRRDCCATWDDNPLITETPLMRAVLDGHPVVPGHALIYPKRHIESLAGLPTVLLIDLLTLLAEVQAASDAEDFTIAVNDGKLAGRTVPHLHVHVIPRRAGDVADPRGGVRGLFVPPERDPWLIAQAGPAGHCRKCDAELGRCVDCGVRALCGEAHCGLHLPNGDAPSGCRVSPESAVGRAGVLGPTPDGSEGSQALTAADAVEILRRMP